MQNYLAQFDKELAKFPLAIELEKRTSVPKAYLFGGVGAFFFLLILFNFWGNFLTTLLGFIWPAYQSFKAIETKGTDDDTQWLTYWCVFGFLNVLEFFGDHLLYWIPFYYTFKAGVILYMILPQFRGATTIYRQVLRPYLIKEQFRIDGEISGFKAKVAAAASEVEKELSTAGKAE
ncbi:ER membrane protein DP1/Yop1 [Irineochytrium annulatum]|nr:ER membrane protein DP1/Yop1 [Irineochytrium annulatum]